MIVIDQLRISDDGQHLYIDAHVNESSDFDNMHIVKVTVCTEDQVHESNPLEYFGYDYVYQKSYDYSEGLWEVHLVLDRNELNEKFHGGDLSHNLFFVYIKCSGTPGPCTPCRLDELTTLGVTFDYNLVFNVAMNYTRELADSCEIPRGFMDFILNLEALKLSVETEHYIPAIGFWRHLMGMDGGSLSVGSVMIKPCGCHG